MPRKQTLPVSQEKISAAQRMWESLAGWRRTDRALAMAQEAFPGNTDLDSVWLKVALLDRLYRTNVFFLDRVVQRVVEVFGNLSRRSSRELVTALAEVQVNDQSRRLVSFASKYVHFFHDNSVLMVDQYAAFALTRHFGEPKARIKDWTGDYSQYCAKTDELIQISALSPTAREMDHYLWLAGNWITLQEKGQKAQINKELLALFTGKGSGRQADATFTVLLR